jgi:hypothetical protein
MASFDGKAAPMTEWEAHFLERICAGEKLLLPDDARLKIQSLFEQLDPRKTGTLQAFSFQVDAMMLILCVFSSNF